MDENSKQTHLREIEERGYTIVKNAFNAGDQLIALAGPNIADCCVGHSFDFP